MQKSLFIMTIVLLFILSSSLFSCSNEYNKGRNALRRNDLQLAILHFKQVTKEDKYYAKSANLIDSINIVIANTAVAQHVADSIAAVAKRIADQAAYDNYVDPGCVRAQMRVGATEREATSNCRGVHAP